MELSRRDWPTVLPAVQVRIARPTDKMDDIKAFYCDLLGLPELHHGDADGYRTLMIGLPDDRYHLEFTSFEGGSPGTAPSNENLLVLYFTSQEEMDDVAGRIRAAGVDDVELENPWWINNGAIAFPDPDEWRLVLMPTAVPLEGRPAGSFDVDEPIASE